jgi:hypothetical protein
VSVLFALTTVASYIHTVVVFTNSKVSSSRLASRRPVKFRKRFSYGSAGFLLIGVMTINKVLVEEVHQSSVFCNRMLIFGTHCYFYS